MDGPLDIIHTTIKIYSDIPPKLAKKWVFTLTKISSCLPDINLPLLKDGYENYNLKAYGH